MSEESSEVGVEIDYLPIKVNEKILLHLGGGIYSSLAAAMKEFVNNAFEAIHLRRDTLQFVIPTKEESGWPVKSRFLLRRNDKKKNGSCVPL